MSRGIKCQWNLWDFWLDVLVMLWGRWMFRLITCLGRYDERVRYLEKPLNVIRRYLPRHYTNLTRSCYVVREMHPPVIYIIIWQWSANRRQRDGLNVPKLAYHPLWSNCDHNRTLSQLTLERWNQLKPPNLSMVSVRQPAHICDRQSVATCPVRRSCNSLHMSFHHQPLADMWGCLLVRIISDALMHARKVLVDPALQKWGKYNIKTCLNHNRT